MNRERGITSVSIKEFLARYDGNARKMKQQLRELTRLAKVNGPDGLPQLDHTRLQAHAISMTNAAAALLQVINELKLVAIVAHPGGIETSDKVGADDEPSAPGEAADGESAAAAPATAAAARPQ